MQVQNMHKTKGRGTFGDADVDSIADTENLGENEEPEVNFEDINSIEMKSPGYRSGRQSLEVGKKRQSALLGSSQSVVANLFDMKASMRQ